MAATNIRGRQIKDTDVTRADLNISTQGSAVITKVLGNANAAITLTSTGADTGTGDVTLSLAIAGASQLGGIKVGSGLSIDGTGVLSVSAAGEGTLKTKQTFTATAGQTSFTITGGYAVGLVDVYLNGVMLSSTSVTATTGTTVVLTDAAEVGDIVEVVILSVLNSGFINGTSDSLTQGTTNLFFTNALARAAISLTTTGTSGAATYNPTTGALNIPQYQGGVTSFNTRTGAITLTSSDVTTALGYTPTTGTATTNTVPKLTAASTIGASNITDTGSLITLGSNSYVNGSLGVGTTSLTGVSLSVSKNILGATTSYGIIQNGAVQSTVTALVFGLVNILNTQAVTFTLTDYRHFAAYQGTIGAGSTVTNQYGFYVDSNLTGATNDYGFYGNLAAGSNSWNLYMNGTASNYLAGQLGVGVTSISASAKVQIDSTTQGFLPPRMTSAQRTAISSPATGLVVYQTDGTEGLYIKTASAWRALAMI